ncbi:hypothetical protein OAG51_03720 [Pirellulaceae bacterium]|jgi:hypothetical protein|nr:hypothetical protein [Pirellulaceae bacterium]
MKFKSLMVTAALLASTSLPEQPVTAQSKKYSPRTSLTDKTIKFEVVKEHFVKLTRGDISAIIVDNSALDLDELPNHRAGYNGIASLTHKNHSSNLFVPGIAGLNFEHIHDGSSRGLKEKFEPRKFPMELRRISRHVVEVYQPPTENWRLESCGRYEILQDGVIQYSFECIPHADIFMSDFIGLFWASYIHQPKDGSISFLGRPTGTSNQPEMIKAVSPKHGVHSTHRPPNTPRLPRIDQDFPLTLVNHPSKYEYTRSWYYGVSNKMAFIQVFRPSDQIWFAQSPSGGGKGNPAWDFQWFIKRPKTGTAYQFVMRCCYLPYESRNQIEEMAQKILQQIN